jgi:small-conductance mechanosensitive channel
VPSVRRVRLALVALIVVLAGLPPAGAQLPIPGLGTRGADPAASTPSGSVSDPAARDGSADARAPAPFPLASLSTALLESRQALRGAERTLRRPLHLEDWQQEIERLLTRSQEISASAQTLPKDQRTFRGLFSLANEWRFVRLRTDLAAEAFQRRLAALQALDSQLSRMQERWALTRQQLPAEAPEGVPAGAIDELATAIEVVDGRARSELEHVLSLQSKLTELQLAVDEGTAWVEETARAERARLFEIDSPPLWTALGDRAQEPAGAARAPGGESLELAAQAVRSPRRIALSVAVLAALYLLFSAARRGLAGLEPPDRLAFVGLALVRRPVRSALLCVLTLQLLLFPRAPAVFYDLLAIAVIAVIASLGGPIMRPALRPYFAGLLVLSLAERLRTLFLAPSLGSRLLLLLIGLLAFAGLAWGIRPGRPERTALAGRWWDTVLVLALAAAALFGSAIVSNVVGNLSLAELLTSSTLASGLAALFLYLLAALGGILLRWWASRPDPRLVSVRTHGPELIAGGTRLMVAAAATGWAFVTLHLFTLAQAVSDWLHETLSHRFVFGALDLSLGDVVAFLLGLAAAVVVARAVSFLLAEEVLPRTAIPRGRASAIVTIVRYLLLAAGFVAAVAMSGFELNRLTLLVSAFGVGVGFGLQNVISNFVAGLILILERPIELGDVVELGSLTGTVRRIGIRSSVVRTFDGASVIVPNSNLISDQVVNWTHSDKLRRIEIRVGAAYGTAPDRVLELLRGAAAGHPKVLHHPPPNPLFVGFGDSSLDFSLRFWTADFDDWMIVQSDVLAAVEAALRGAGIEIPFPQRDLHLRSFDPAAREALRDAPQPPPAP